MRGHRSPDLDCFLGFALGNIKPHTEKFIASEPVGMLGTEEILQLRSHESEHGIACFVTLGIIQLMQSVDIGIDTDKSFSALLGIKLQSPLEAVAVLDLCKEVCLAEVLDTVIAVNRSSFHAHKQRVRDYGED